MKFKYTDHKDQYDKMSTFVQNFIQSEMRTKYSLQEIMVPEDKHIDEEYQKMPKCNIFMSREFYEPNPEQNRGRCALVLIQGAGAVRAGIWARSVCINENLELREYCGVFLLFDAGKVFKRFD